MPKVEMPAPGDFGVYTTAEEAREASKLKPAWGPSGPDSGMGLWLNGEQWIALSTLRILDDYRLLVAGFGGRVVNTNIGDVR